MAAMFAGAVHAGSNVAAASMDVVNSEPTPQVMGLDVSKVPAGPAPSVPIPYPNTPLDESGDPVKKNTMPTQKQDATPIGSTGDEGGTLKGVVAPKIKQTPARVLSSPVVVDSEGANVTRLGSPTFHNAPGGAPAMSAPPAMRTPPAAPPPAVRAERAARPPLILQQPALQRRP
jgi:hypothetical protein